MTILHLVRHGETDWNLAGRIQGTTDIPLNDTGREQAREAAGNLRPLLSDGAIAMVASDLARARETSEIIAVVLGLPAPVLYASLRERAYGQAEGTTSAEFTARWSDWRTTRIPGAETPQQLRHRAIGAIRRVAADVRRASAPGAASAVVVTHGAFIREIVTHASNGDLPSPGSRIGNGSVHSILVERHRVRMLAPATV